MHEIHYEPQAFIDSNITLIACGPGRDNPKGVMDMGALNFSRLFVLLVLLLNYSCQSESKNYREVSIKPPEQARAEAEVDSEQDSDDVKSEKVSSAGECFQSADGDYTEKGPDGFKEGPSNSGRFIITPQNMKDGCKYSVIVFGMGTGAPTSAYTGFYEHFASYGFVVVVDPTKNGQSSGESMRATLDWAYQSELKDMLSDKAGATGHSQGGGGAYATSSHDKIKAIVGLQPGQFRSANNTTAAYLGLAGTNDSFGVFTNPSFLHYPGSVGVDKFMASHVGANHIQSMINTQSGPGVNYKAAATAWFRCYLADDENACQIFSSGTCDKLPGGGSNWTECKGQMAK